MEGDQPVGDTRGSAGKTQTFPAALKGVKVFTELNLVGGELPTWLIPAGSAVPTVPASVSGAVMRQLRGTKRRNVTGPRRIWQEAKETGVSRNPAPGRGRCRLYLTLTLRTLAREN